MTERRQLIILGDNLCTYISAASILCSANNTFDIHIISDPDKDEYEAPQLSVTPLFRGFLQYLDIPEKAFMKNCQASFHYGANFQDWTDAIEDFPHVYSEYGIKHGLLNFTDVLLSSSEKSPTIEHFSLGALAAQANRFSHPSAEGSNILSTLQYGYILNTEATKQFLKKVLHNSGVNFISSPVNGISQTDSGKIISLQLAENNSLPCDLVIDTTFDASVANQINPEKINWDNELPPLHSCVAEGQSSEPQLLSYYSRLQVGWLEENQGIQSRCLTAYSFKQLGLDEITPSASEFKIKSNGTITSHMRQNPWVHNCIALGKAAVDIPTLNFSHADMTWGALQSLVTLIFNGDRYEYLSQEYNRLVTLIYQQFKDLSKLYLNEADVSDSEFWQTMRTTPQSPENEARLALFKDRGKVIRRENDIFPEAFYATLFVGFGVQPKRLHPITQQSDQQELEKRNQTLTALIDKTLQGMPKHSTYLQQYLA